MKKPKKKVRTIRGWVLRYDGKLYGEDETEAPCFFTSKYECSSFGPDWERVRATMRIHG